MAELTVGDRVIALNEDGFLADPTQWDEEVACALAANEGIELTDAHWKIINYLRNYYAEFGVAPMIRKLRRDTGASNAEINELFPSGLADGVCKIAGLSASTGCV